MKIVVGVDGSEPSNRAVKWCATYAGVLDAEIVVVHSIDMPVYTSLIPGSFPVAQLVPQDFDELRERITLVWCAPLAKANVPFRVVLMSTGPAPAIIEVAKTEQADLVVTGRRGGGGFAELVLGSTSRALTHHLDCPLVLVP